MWPNIKTLWSEMALFRYTTLFFAIGVFILLNKII